MSLSPLVRRLDGVGAVRGSVFVLPNPAADLVSGHDIEGRIDVLDLDALWQIEDDATDPHVS